MATQITRFDYFDGGGNRLLSIPAAAGYYGVPERTLRDWAEKDKIPAQRRGKLWRVQQSGLIRYLRLREIGHAQ